MRGFALQKMEPARSKKFAVRQLPKTKKIGVPFKAYGSTYQTRQGGYDSGGLVELLPLWLVVWPSYDCEYHIAHPLESNCNATYPRVQLLVVHVLCCALIRDASWSTREQCMMAILLAWLFH